MFKLEASAQVNEKPTFELLGSDSVHACSYGDNRGLMYRRGNSMDRASSKLDPDGRFRVETMQIVETDCWFKLLFQGTKWTIDTEIANER
jgi:hypothetical protein